MQDLDGVRIGVVGLGYVGLPVAVAFGTRFPTVGFDINRRRIAELTQGIDLTREVTPQELTGSRHLRFSHETEDLAGCSVYVVTVPTPIDDQKRPDLAPLTAATRTVAATLGKGDVVIYESTVYPGVTEDICVPILEEGSGLRLGADFHVAYSPERINPGDRRHRLADIRKVVSGSTPDVTDFVASLYEQIITAGVYKASSIRVAEAAKVIENTQRDVNIGLMNELALIFDRLGIDTEEVLAAAGTKWNFLPFRPGLVGGHCIGVDPYYLTSKAQEVGYHPEIILSGRRINDGMGAYVAERVVKLMIRRRLHVAESRVLVLGLAFKENCPDLRNTRVIDIVHELRGFEAAVDVYDPWVDAGEAKAELGIDLLPDLEDRAGSYDAVVLAVAHDAFRDMGVEAIRGLGHDMAVLFDVKYLLPADKVDGRL